MANYTEAQWNAKKVELMETCFNGFADLGLHGTGIRTLAKHCGTHDYPDRRHRVLQS